jgi:hypothetical protein
VDSRRPNECPRCGFAYTGFNRPKPANSTFAQRFARSLREQRSHGSGLFAKSRYAAAEHVRPWQCRCGTWLQARPWSFGWVDVVGITVLAAVNGTLATQFSWARNAYAFAIPIGLWVGYRTTLQVAVTEVAPSSARELSSEGNS